MITQTGWAVLVGLTAIGGTLLLWRTGRRQRNRRERFGVLLRVLGLAFLAAALSGPYWPRSRVEATAVLLVDVSESCRSAVARELPALRNYLDRLPKGARAATLLFAEEPVVVIPPGAPENNAPERWADRLREPPVPTEGTSLERAVLQGLGLLPPWGERRILLLSDGAETLGQVELLLPRLQAERVPIDVLPLRPEPIPDARLLQIEVPPKTREGESVPVRLILESTQRGTGTLSLLVDGQTALTQTLSLSVGVQEWEGSLPPLVRESAEIVAFLKADWDHQPANDRIGAIVERAEPPVLAFVPGPAGPSPLARLLQEAKGYRWIQLSPEALPRSAAEYRAWTALLLDDLPAEALDPTQQAALRDAVQNLGVGLLSLGGPHTYGLGGWQGTPLEELTPVRMVPQDRHLPLGLVLVLDKSGSMAGTAEGLSKLDLARIAVRAAMEALQPQDRLSVVAFDREPEVLLRWQSPEASRPLLDAIRRLRPGNGTDIPAALEAAARLFEGVHFPRKQLLLLSDGYSIGDLLAAARRVEEAGITLSVVGIGEAAHPALEEMAALTGGRYYPLSDARALPRIVAEESRQEGELWNPGPVSVVPAMDHPLAVSELPPVEGYLSTAPKPAAEVYLRTPAGDPILAGWWFGLGRVLTLTTDGGRWSRRWLADPRARGAFRAWVEAVLPAVEEPFDLTTNLNGARLEVRAFFAEANDLAEFLLRAPEGTVQKVRAPVRRGVAAAGFDLRRVGTYRLSVRAPQGATVRREILFLGGAEYRVPPDPERLRRLAEATGGQYYSPPAKGWAPIRPRPWVQERPLRSWLLGLGLLLVFCEWVVRQLGVPRRRRPSAEPTVELLARLNALRRERWRRAQDSVSVLEHWERLRTARERARS
ncbi:MAG: hypothetical protein KatS3mg115_0080 [Candidatus Poribacteria bacterium]|nr:MAG: hypothetical protein KatS3mg115_0080 [Candidatus Poribacteria bacterium]